MMPNILVSDWMKDCDRRVLMKYEGGMLHNAILLEVQIVNGEYVLCGYLSSKNNGPIGHRRIDKIIKIGLDEISKYGYHWLKGGSILIY